MTYAHPHMLCAVFGWPAASQSHLGLIWRFLSRPQCLPRHGPTMRTLELWAQNIACVSSNPSSFLEDTCTHVVWFFSRVCPKRFYVQSCMGQGDITRNGVAVGIAVSKLGMRASQGMLEQAVYQFLSLCLPRGQEICSPLASITHFFFDVVSSMHACRETCF